MNKIKYQFHILYNTMNKPTIIKFYKDGNKFEIIEFYILIYPKPILKLYCHEYNNQTKLYEYGINYIIDNKIGKYNHLEIKQYIIGYDHVIITNFDIIDKELLIQLI